MPDFYADDILKSEDVYCVSPFMDKFLVPVLNRFGICKSMESYGYRKDEKGWPLLEDCQSRPFADYYVSQEAFSLFRALYDNKSGLQGKFLMYWDQLAKKFASNKYVIGFDPINEPDWAFDSISSLVGVIFDGTFAMKSLAPMYTGIFEKLQAADTKASLWFEPAQADIFRPSRFEKPPGGEIGSQKHVLNDHTYCSFNPAMEYPCKLFHYAHLGMRKLDADKLQIPLFITEFGSCDNSEGCVTEITTVLDVIDSHMISGWAYW